jgi:hypothetical protein
MCELESVLNQTFSKTSLGLYRWKQWYLTVTIAYLLVTMALLLTMASAFLHSVQPPTPTAHCWQRLKTWMCGIGRKSVPVGIPIFTYRLISTASAIEREGGLSLELDVTGDGFFRRDRIEVKERLA